MRRPHIIKQDDLQAVLTARLEVETRKRDLDRAKDELDKLELVLIGRLKDGAHVAPGELDAGIQETQGARRPAWKELFAHACGPEAVERAIADTVPAATLPKLVILTRGRITKTA